MGGDHINGYPCGKKSDPITTSSTKIKFFGWIGTFWIDWSPKS